MSVQEEMIQKQLIEANMKTYLEETLQHADAAE